MVHHLPAMLDALSRVKAVFHFAKYRERHRYETLVTTVDVY